MMFKQIIRAIGLAGALASFSPAPMAHGAPPVAEQLHARAAWSFQHGRYPEAYGRFMALADAGHAPAAEVALFMYANGRALFGSDWDVTPDQLAAWAGLVGRPVPVMLADVSSHRVPAPTSRPH